jgi:hypothetical protein
MAALRRRVGVLILCAGGLLANEAGAAGIATTGVTWSWTEWNASQSGVVGNWVTQGNNPSALSAPAPTASAALASASPAVPAVNATAAQVAVAPASTPRPVAGAPLSPLPSPPAAVPVASGTTGPVASQVDGFINLGNGPYPNADLLTSGGAQPWYDSAQVMSLFGGMPNAQQQASFTTAILQRVERTFQLSGVPVTLTTDPTVPAAHTLSVVSNTVNSTLPSAVGMTILGGNGFSFIDQSAKLAQSVDQLEWIVAHNVAHELMLAFGVGENYDQTGNYIDARNANFAMMVNPNATFSQAAAQALLAENFQTNSGAVSSLGAQLLNPQTVPEPATVAVWALGAVALGLIHRCRSTRGRAGA